MKNITYQQANRCIDLAIQYARHQSLPPLAIVVLDGAKQVRASAIEDDAGRDCYEIAYAKAHSAIDSATKLQNIDRLGAQNTSIDCLTSSLALQDSFEAETILCGLVIQEGRHVMGALGVAGALECENETLAKEVLNDIFNLEPPLLSRHLQPVSSVDETRIDVKTTAPKAFLASANSLSYPSR